MIIIPEIETVVVLVPRTGSKSLRKTIAATYPQSFQLYRHMEADGVPQGYDRWRRFGVCRDPLARLWSLYRFIKIMGGPQDYRGKWEPAYVARQRASVARPFQDWLLHNNLPFTGPYDSAGINFYPGFTVRHSLPENRKSQFIYLRPDLGTTIIPFSRLDTLREQLGLPALHQEHIQPKIPPPMLGAEAAAHMFRYFEWDYGVAGVEPWQ